jgi:hypothetical protein
MTIELPYPYDYPVMADYLRAVKPVRKYWAVLHPTMNPAEYWKWSWEQEDAEACQ